MKLSIAFASLALLTAPILTTTAETLGHQLTATQAVDLTHALHNDMAFWPGGIPFTKTQLVGYEDGFLLHSFEMAENTGTHVDAPAHFIAGSTPIDALTLSQLIVPAIVIDIAGQVESDVDYQLARSDIEAWEDRNGPIPAGSLVIVNSGWHRRFQDAESYFNMDDNGVMHFPGFGVDAAELLIERDVAGVGIDTLSIDNGPSATFAVHQALLGAGIYPLENLARLDQVPATGATVVVGVLPVRDGSQAQARIVALLP